MTRKLQFDQIHNFRDFGGYSAAGGKSLKRGQLLRSASHALATDADLDRMAALKIGAIVDLRRPSERATNPSRRWDNFAATVIENDDDHEGDEGWDTFIRHSDLSAEAIRTYLTRYYAAGVHLPRHIDLFSRYFDTLAETDGALLVHCAAGKDRTGMIVALTHTLAGVHRDDIMEDYLLTNDPERFAQIGPHFRDVLLKQHGRAPDPDLMHQVMGVAPPYLDAAFASIEAEYGHVETYLSKTLGVDKAKRAKIEAKLFD